MLVSKILAAYVPCTYSVWAQEVKEFYRKIRTLVDQRGLEWTVGYVKLTRLAVTRYLSGHPLESLPGIELVSGYPLWILGTKPLTESRDGLRLLMTLLVSLRSLKFKPVLNLDDIVRPWSGTDSISEKELGAACYALGIRRAQVDFTFPHMSTKRGPLGQALMSAPSELTLLPQSLLHDLVVIGGRKLFNLIESLTDRLDVLQWSSVAILWSREFPSKKSSLRRLSFFSDKEGKTRVVGILDYWTQTALLPLHKALNRVLRRIKTDCTFNQNHFLSILPSTGPYYSLDLHAATDRMPLCVQQRIITKVIGEEKARAWASALTAMEFTISGQHHTSVKYGAGQPMGAYSSWPAMALTHHVLVRVAARRAGKTVFFTDYALLGDDIVIANEQVALAYKELLSTLDMPISEAKSHISLDTYEFAKRWIWRGSEITGFQVGGLFTAYKRYPLLHNFLSTQSQHGWILPIGEHPDLISSILKVMRGPKFIGEHCDRIVALYMVFDKVLSELHTQNWSMSVFNTLSQYMGIHAPWDNVLGYQETLRRGFLLARKRLVERDLKSFQSDLYVINDKLHALALKQIPSSADQATREFMKATVSVVINWDNPLVLVLNRIIDDSMALLMHALDETVCKDNFYLEAGLSKYFISKSVFSMKSSESKLLAESAVNKEFITVMKDFTNGVITIDDLRDAGKPTLFT
jgi:hypothetical protein